MRHEVFSAIGKTCVLALFAICSVASYGQPSVAVPDGYAAQNGGTTGGGDAAAVTVTTAEAFKSAIKGNAPAVIIVQGKLNVGDVRVGSNKTIIGADATSGLHGGCIGVKGNNNVIFQNLIIGPNTKGDAMEISTAKNVFVTKCEFVDGSDGSLDIVRESDFVTVSWCKFYYVDQTNHRNTILIGNKDNAPGDEGKLHVTMHHNWFAEKCDQRMPRVRFGVVHLYNNYYSSAGNMYCIGTGIKCNIRVENSHFDGINAPWKDYGGAESGKMGWAGLKFDNCTEPAYMPNTFPVFVPPYEFSMDKVDDVKKLVTDAVYGAGNRQTRTASN